MSKPNPIPTPAGPAPRSPRKPRQKTDKNETKAAKFTRLATARMKKALKAIRQLANLGGSAYESTPDQRAKIGTALSKAVSDTMTSMDRVKANNEPGFTL